MGDIGDICEVVAFGSGLGRCWAVSTPGPRVWDNVEFPRNVDGKKPEGEEFDLLVEQSGVGDGAKLLVGQDGKQGLVVECQQEAREA